MSDAEGGMPMELVMPFVCVKSKGGPYDDDAFTAGYALGITDARLEAGLEPPKFAIRTSDVPQLDLIAMRWGWLVTGTHDADGWSSVTWEKVPDGLDR